MSVSSSDICLIISDHGRTPLRRRADKLRYNDLVLHRGQFCSIREIACPETRCSPVPPADHVSVLIAGGDVFVEKPSHEFDIISFWHVVASYGGWVEILDIGQCYAKQWAFGAIALAVVLSNGEIVTV